MPALRRFAVASAAFVSLACGAAYAQNTDLDPSFGTTTLVSGFRPDPVVVQVRSGGSIDAQTINPGCKGFIAGAPDVRLQFEAATQPLIVSVASDADTTLVIHGPDGGWYCDDNSGSNHRNPSLRFSHPQSGQYDVWIGAPAANSLAAAELNVSETISQ
jgi:hypothetical protein